MRSRARSRLRARAWPDELAASWPRSANHRVDGLAANPLTFVRAERVAIEKAFATDNVFMREVDDPEIDVKAWRDVTHVFQTEATRDVRRRNGRHHRQLDPFLREQELP